MSANSPVDDHLNDTKDILRMLTSMLKRHPVRCLPGQDRLVTSASDGLYELLGFSGIEKMLSPRFPLHKFIHPEDEELVNARLAEALNGRQPFHLVYRIQTTQAEVLWVSEEGRGIYDNSGTLMETESLISDVSVRKMAVDDMHKQKLFFESTLHKMPVELIVLDKDQKYLFVNSAAIKDDALRSWIIGRDDFEYCRERGRDVNVALDRKMYFTRAVKDRAEVEWEEVNPDGQGGFHYSLKRYSPIFDSDGTLKLIIGYGFNITDRRRAEEQVRQSELLLKTIHSNIQDGIFRFMAEQGLIYANQALADMFGYEVLEELYGSPILFFFEDHRQRKALINEIEQFGSVRNKEVELRRQDKTKFWAMVSCVRNSDAQGQIYFDGAVVDISELKSAEEVMRTQNTELQKANTELARFVYSASHDLRAPLTSILGILKVAEAETDIEKMRELHKLIRNSVHRLDHFVHELIDYYRSSRSEIEVARVSFESLISDSFDNIKYGYDGATVRLITDIRERTPFYSDQHRLVTIFSNILSNAVKYHDYSKPDPWIAVRINSDEDRAVIHVEDNGSGIDERHLDKIFTMFYRASQGPDGTGLGLYIVKEAVDRLHGTVSVQSRAGEGTTFTVVLPNQHVSESVSAITSHTI